MKSCKKFVPIGTYASLNLETDRTNDVAQMRAAKFGTAIGKVSSALSFVRSELLALDEAVLQEAAALSPLYKRYLEELLKQNHTSSILKWKKRWQPSVPHLTRHIKRTIRRN